MTDKPDSEKNVGASDKNEAFEDRPRLPRSPVRTGTKGGTRSRTKLSTEEELGVKNAEIERLREQLARLHESVVETNRVREKENKLTSVLGEIGRRLDAIESREEGVFRNRGRDEYVDAREESSGETRDAERQVVAVGENTVIQARLPKGGWLRNPFEELKYTGRSDPQNPMRFLSRFERIAKYEGVGETEQLYYFGKCMRGTASSWYDVHEPEDIEEAKNAFTEHFWGEEQQARFREEIYTGTYRAESNATMSEYALGLSKKAKYLIPPMSVHEIIRCVKRHFGPGIAREIRPTTVKTIEEFVNLLDELEYERKRVQKERLRNEKTRGEKSSYGDRRSENAGRAANKEGAYVRGQASTGTDANKGKEGQSAYRGAYRNYAANYARRDNAERVASEKEKGDSSSDSQRATNKELVLYDKEVANKAMKEASGKKNYPNRKNVAAIGTCENANGSEEEIEEKKNIAIIRTREIIRDVDEVTEEDQRETVVKAVPFVTVMIGEMRVKTLIDTGAQISAITKTLYDKIINEGVQVRLIPIKKFSLVGAFSDRGQPIANGIQIAFRMNEKEFTHELYVVKNLSYEMILGHDFLSEQAAILRCGREEFELKFPESNEMRFELNAISMKDAEEQIKIILDKNAELFEDKIGCVSHYRHEIKMNVDKPYRAKVYPIPDAHRARVKEHLMELESTGIVERSTTQYVNPLVVVVKKTGEIRLCLDAREMNKRMANDHDQPLTIDEVFRRIGDKKYFSTLDVAKAFWQIPLTDDSKQYTGFKFNNQTYVFKRLPFGLKTASASFTRAMNRAIGDECDPFTIVYLDDILIASSSLEEHLFHVNYVLEKLRKVRFRLNREKCELLKTEIRFFGHTFNQIKAEMNEDTKMAIQNFEKPRNKKAIQAFLGLINWDRRFIKNLATMAKPLERLLRKGEKFAWTEVEQNAFNELKRAFREAPSLFVIRPTMKFGIFVDASKYGLGARLYQYNDEEEEKRYTVAYASRSLKGAELNYTVTEVECLALVWALRKWHTTLLGRYVRVHSDHRALKFLAACADDSARIARWMAFLNEFDLDIRHIPGKENQIADTLSRNNVKNGYVKKEGKTKTIAAIGVPDDEVETTRWIEMIAKAQCEDERLQREREVIPDDLPERNGLIRICTKKGERIIVPEAVKWELIRRVHNFLLHFGTDKVSDFVSDYFEVQNLERVVRDVVASCETCQATKYYTRPTRGIEYYDLPSQPGQVVSLDIFGPLPQTPRGNKYILVLMDQFSKLVRFYAMKNQKLETILDCLQVEYFQEIGVPNEILTDNGGQFVTNRWREFAVDMGFSVRKTSPYNPQSNPVERVMREIGRIVRVYAHTNQTRWDRIVKRAENTINITTHRSTEYRPIDLYIDFPEPLFIDRRLKPKRMEEEEGDGEEIIEKRIEIATEVLNKRAQQRKTQMDKHGEREAYQPNDKVWVKLHRRSDANRRLTKKIHLVYEGPFVIQNEVRKNAYVVKDSDDNVIGTFNSRQLRPHRETKLKPTMEINMMEPEVEIKRIPQREVEKYITNLRNKREEILTGEEPMASSTPKKQRRDIPEDPGNSDEESERFLKKKRSIISEKGMRHITRLVKLISGKTTLPYIMGLVEEQRMKILLDTRGEFNVITKAAINLIEKNNRVLERIKNSENIPAYLKREKRAKIRAVEVSVETLKNKTTVEAMILEAKEPCLMIGRHTRREMEKSLKSSLVVAYELTRWSEHLSEDTRRRLEREEKRKNRRKEAESRCKKKKLEKNNSTRKQEERDFNTSVSCVTEVPSQSNNSETNSTANVKESMETMEEIVKKVVSDFKRENSIIELKNSRENTCNLSETHVKEESAMINANTTDNIRDKDKSVVEITKSVDKIDRKARSVDGKVKSVDRVSEKTKSADDMSKETWTEIKSVNKTLNKTFDIVKSVDERNEKIKCIQADMVEECRKTNSALSRNNNVVKSANNYGKINNSIKLSKQDFLRELELNSSEDTIILESESDEEDEISTKNNISEIEKISSKIVKNSVKVDNHLFTDDKITSLKVNNIVETGIEARNKCNTAWTNTYRNKCNAALTNTYKSDVYRWRERIERSLVRNGLKGKIQDGSVTTKRVTSCTNNSEFFKENSENKEKMLSQEKWDKLYEEEDELVKRILAEVKLRATEAKCLQRIQMLRSLAEQEDDQTRPSMQEIDKTVEREDRRTKEIFQKILTAVAAENMCRVFFDKSRLENEEGSPEHEVMTIVAIRNLKQTPDAIKPINVNVTIEGNNMTKNVMYVKEGDLVIPGELGEVSKEELKEITEEKQASKKPRIISDVEIKLFEYKKIAAKIKGEDENNNQKKTKGKRVLKRIAEACKQPLNTNVQQQPEEQVQIKEVHETRASVKRRKMNVIDSDDDDDSEKALSRGCTYRQSPLAGDMRSVEQAPSKEIPWSDRQDKLAREASPASSRGTRTPRYRRVQEMTEPKEDGVQRMTTFLERISDSEDSEVQLRGDDEQTRPKPLIE
ncbi:s68306 pol retrotransposon woot [Lasius niger]|uniref:RNA-directed DNA polymerase n=2 Tax=Lasius niger TaxID=67767 RepID=A0A0J7KHW9_LASNI|nr:s68306 pol retrotransposon woot [Lasius niger]